MGWSHSRSIFSVGGLSGMHSSISASPIIHTKEEEEEEEEEEEATNLKKKNSKLVAGNSFFFLPVPLFLFLVAAMVPNLRVSKYKVS